jgi:YbbR domain-containing protein
MRIVFVQHRELKLLATLLAILTYYTIRGATGFEVPYEIPVDVRVDQREGIAILDQDVRTVEVTFRGSQDDLRLLDPREIRAVVKPKAISADGAEEVTIKFRDVQGASGVRVVKIRPSTLTVRFDRQAEKKVSVIRPRIIGAPLVGKVELEYEPRFVTITGPKRRLDDKQAVVTEPVDVDGRVTSFSKQVKVLPPGDAWVSDVQPSTITVHVKIVTESTSRELERVPVLALMRPAEACGLEFEPTEVKVVLHGRAEALENLAPDSVKVFADTTDLEPGASYELPVNAHLPSGVDINADVEPRTVRVSVRESAIKEAE